MGWMPCLQASGDGSAPRWAGAGQRATPVQPTSRACLANTPPPCACTASPPLSAHFHGVCWMNATWPPENSATGSTCTRKVAFHMSKIRGSSARGRGVGGGQGGAVRYNPTAPSANLKQQAEDEAEPRSTRPVRPLHTSIVCAPAPCAATEGVDAPDWNSRFSASWSSTPLASASRSCVHRGAAQQRGWSGERLRAGGRHLLHACAVPSSSSSRQRTVGHPLRRASVQLVAVHLLAVRQHVRPRFKERTGSTSCTTLHASASPATKSPSSTSPPSPWSPTRSPSPSPPPSSTSAVLEWASLKAAAAVQPAWEC